MADHLWPPFCLIYINIFQILIYACYLFVVFHFLLQFTGLQKDYLPACMLNKNFQLNGIHIWLRPPSEQLCKKRPRHPPRPCSKTTTTIVQINIYPHDYYIGTANPPRAPSLTLIFILIISIGLL